MFKIKDTKKNIAGFTTSKGWISYNTKQEELFLNDTRIDTKTSTCGYFFSDKYFSFSNNSDFQNSILDLKTNQVSRIGKISLQIQTKRKELYIAFEKTNGNKSLILFDIETLKKVNIIENFDLGISLLFEDNLVITEGWTKIKSLSIETGEYLWETQINRNAEILKLLGIRADELIVCLKRGNMDFGLLGINIHTGEIAWNMDDNDLLNGYTLNFSPDENALFCVKNSGFKSYYLELDLFTKKPLRFDEIPNFFDLGLIIERIWVKDNLIYFFARKGSKFSTVAGVMDYKTLEILWQEQIVVGSWAYLSDLQVDNDKLYILDGEGVLHIFEKEIPITT